MRLSGSIVATTRGQSCIWNETTIGPSTSLPGNAERMNRGSETRMPRGTRYSLSSLSFAPAEPYAMASSRLLFPEPFAPMSTLTRPSSSVSLRIDL